jgi:methyl-accepting chemotaxis protein
VIEFQLDGTVLTANENFLNALGYTLLEIQGTHHSMFVEPAYRESAEYRAFCDRIRAGQYDAQQYERIAKGGREIWLQPGCNPIFDAHGRPYEVATVAPSVTGA